MIKRWIINIMDQSGSMYNLKSTVLKEYNHFLAEFKEHQDDIRWTTILFNDSITNLNDDSIKNILELQDNDYNPTCKTALLDAIGNACMKIIRNSVEYNDIIMNIYTDGEENSSKIYSYESINEILEAIKCKIPLTTNFYCNNSNNVLSRLSSIDYSYVNANFQSCMRQMSSNSHGDSSYPSLKRQKRI